MQPECAVLLTTAFMGKQICHQMRGAKAYGDKYEKKNIKHQREHQEKEKAFNQPKHYTMLWHPLQ